MILLIISFAVSGYVMDKDTGEPLPFANIMVKGSDMGVASNERGYFYLKFPSAGEYTLKVSFIGYRDWEKTITMVSDTTLNLNIGLVSEPIYLKGVKITASRRDFEKAVDLSRITITPSEIRYLPSFFEADVFRSIQILPGVVTMHDLSNKLYIRGGSPDEVYVSLDHITVYNPTSHLFGLFSMFNPDIVKNIEVYTGGYPAMYGGRLSGVISVLTKDGNKNQYQLNLSTGLISTILTLQGPVPWGTFFFSGRRTYFDLLVWLYGKLWHQDISLPYYFYDLIGKTTIDRWKDTKISGTFMQGMDVLDFSAEETDERILLKWGNTGEVLRIERAQGNLFFNTYLSHTIFNTDFRLQPDTIYSSQGIENYSVIQYVDFFLGEDRKIQVGIERNKILFHDKLGLPDTSFSRSTNDIIVPYEGFLNLEASPGPIWRFNLGLRGLYLSDNFYIEPRAGVKYRLDENTNLLFSGGIYHQYIATLNSQESYFLLYDFWTPIKSDIPWAWHFVGGYEKWLGDGENLRVEAYYKKYERVLIPGEFFDFFSIPAESLKRGSGYAMGVELLLKKKIKNFSVWLSYGFGITKRRIDTLVYSPRYDRRHNLNLFLGYSSGAKHGFLKGLTVSARFSFGSGLPFAAPMGWYYRRDIDIYMGSDSLVEYPFVIQGRKDSGRLPPVHRLDLHIEKMIESKKKNMGFYIDIINLYARRNVLFYDYYIDENGQVQRESISILPIPIITAGVRLKL